MNQQAIFAPFFAMLTLTACVWVYMYSRRLPFLIRNKVDLDNIKPADIERSSPPELLNPSNNLKNLFEVPIIFYALCLYLFVTNQVDQIYMTAAWVFVAFRVLHSFVHCTGKKVIVRFGLYMVSAFALWFIAIRAAINYLVAA
ncbi:MAG: MAPEG family protein [Woeseiaceae bacterium]